MTTLTTALTSTAVPANPVALAEGDEMPTGPAAHQLAERLVNRSTRALQATKAVLNSILRETTNLVLDASLAMEKERFAVCDHAAAGAALDRIRAAAG